MLPEGESLSCAWYRRSGVVRCELYDKAKGLSLSFFCNESVHSACEVFGTYTDAALSLVEGLLDDLNHRGHHKWCSAMYCLTSYSLCFCHL